MDYVLRMWYAMSWNDCYLVGSSMVATVGVTLLFVYMVYKLCSKAPGTSRRNARGTKTFTVGEPKVGTTPDATDPVADAAVEPPPEWKLDRQTKRNIPLGAADSLVQRGNRLIEEKQYKEALVCFLSLLYSAVEGGVKNAGDNLPTHLADCLRGAAICYRNLGEPATAVRFLQAERLLFEEMVASLHKKDDGITPGKAIVASLLGSSADTSEVENDPKSAPLRRCRVLNGVADECMRHGNPQVALSYRVKAAAVKQKITKQPIDPHSEEFARIAEAMHACEQALKNVREEDRIAAVQSVIAKEAATM